MCWIFLKEGPILNPPHYPFNQPIQSPGPNSLLLLGFKPTDLHLERIRRDHSVNQCLEPRHPIIIFVCRPDLIISKRTFSLVQIKIMKIRIWNTDCHRCMGLAICTINWNARRKLLNDLKQEELSITQYFINILNRRWQHIDLFDENKFGCTKYSQKYKKIVGKEHVFKFLFGLNKNLDEVRGWILGTKPLPSLPAVRIEIRREESR